MAETSKAEAAEQRVRADHIENHLRVYAETGRDCSCRFHRALKLPYTDAHINVNADRCLDQQPTPEQPIPPVAAAPYMLSIDRVIYLLNEWGHPDARSRFIELRESMRNRETQNDTR